MSGEIFTDAPMLEIFRAEVETHVEALTAGLLALERDPADTSHLDEMMRGAHSIKGAARIVGIDVAVRLAHVMEDTFVAAQNGKLMFQSDAVDVLLRGVDLLNRIANATANLKTDWTQLDTEVQPLVAGIANILAGNRVTDVTPLPPAATLTTTQNLSQAVPPASASTERTITIPSMLDAGAAEIARQAFVAALDAQNSPICFDVSATRDLDATGLAFLAAIPANMDKNGPRIELSGMNADLKLVLQATGIEQLYPAGGC